MASIFTKIIQGEIPCYKVAEDDHFFAFLDIRPVAFGHTLVVPKSESEYIFDMGDKELSELMLFSKKIAGVLKQVVPCSRIGVSVIGLEVPHTHVHLIPIQTMEDMNFSKSRVEVKEEEYLSLSKKLQESFNGILPGE